MLVKVYNQEGKETGQTRLPKEIFGVKISQDLVHQVAVSQMANRRQIIAHAKDRSEVRGGGRKPWRQKGTGRARHGSIRSPLWRGGGVTFGPTKNRIFKKKINRKARRQALFMVLSGKLKDNELVLLDELKIEKTKTKFMAKILNIIFEKILKIKLTKKTKPKSILVVLPKGEKEIIRATKNIPKAGTARADSLNVLDLLKYKYLMMPKEAVGVIESTFLSPNSKAQISNQIQNSND